MRKTVTLFAIFGFGLFGNAVFAQTGPTSVSTSTNIVVAGGTKSYALSAHSASVNGVVPSHAYTLNYQNTGNVRINDFTLSGSNYVNFAVFDTVIFRRAANAWETTGGDKQHVYTEGPSTLDNTTYTLNMPVAYPNATGQQFMQKAIREGYINRGSDNVFNNDSTSDLTYNNIERVDFVYRLGLASLDVTKAGFLIAERGGNDPFKIAAITAVDASGNPTAFGSVLAVNTSGYGGNVYNAFTYVMRKDAGDNDIRLFSKVPNQTIKTVFISFQNLGVTALQKIYGYALMGNDVTATTSAQVLNFTNTTYFPRNTNNANGGMDMASAPGIYHTNMVLAGRFFAFNYQKRNCDVVLNWNDPRFAEVKEYIIEKSYDQLQYTPLATVTATRADGAFTDAQPKTAAFYRIKAVSREGEPFYSEVLHVANVCGTSEVTVFPNPVADVLTLTTSNENPVKQIKLQNFNGSVAGSWNLNNGSNIVRLDLSGMASGQYLLVLTRANNQREVHKIVKK